METVVKVQGMTCQGCVKSVTRVLQALRYDPGRATVEDFRKAVEDAGFAVA
jgi:copper chaperone